MRTSNFFKRARQFHALAAAVVGWLVRAALDAPKWRWLGINHANAALIALRSVLLFNDTGHLPAELRWTGFPQELHV